MNFWDRGCVKCIMVILGILFGGCLVIFRNRVVLVRIGRVSLVVVFLYSVLNCSWVLFGLGYNGVKK